MLPPTVPRCSDGWTIHESGICIPCAKCQSFNRITLEKCTAAANAKCGHCKIGYYPTPYPPRGTPDQYVRCIPDPTHQPPSTTTTTDQPTTTWTTDRPTTGAPPPAPDQQGGYVLPTWVLATTLTLAFIVLLVLLLFVMYKVYQKCVKSNKQGLRNTNSSRRHDAVDLEESSTGGNEGVHCIKCVDPDHDATSPENPLIPLTVVDFESRINLSECETATSSTSLAHDYSRFTVNPSVHGCFTEGLSTFPAGAEKLGCQICHFSNENGQQSTSRDSSRTPVHVVHHKCDCHTKKGQRSRYNNRSSCGTSTTCCSLVTQPTQETRVPSSSVSSDQHELHTSCS